MSVPLVIYHAACRDGFAAAWACSRVLGDADYHEGFYGQEPPDVRGRDVYLVDFTYHRKTLLAMASVANSITILDHHKTAKAELEAGEGYYALREECHRVYGLTLPVNVVFDMERSGAGITWDTLVVGDTQDGRGACVECHGHLHGYERHDPGCPSRAPWPIRYVEDRDLWRFALPNSREVSAYLGAVPFTFKAWDALLDMPLDEAVAAGRAVQMKVRQYATEVWKNAVTFSFHGHEVPIVNAPQCDVSELLEHAMDQTGKPFVMAWWQRADRMYQYSLRSRGDLDVSAIAKEHGGGGHKNASGFQLKTPLSLEV